MNDLSFPPDRNAAQARITDFAPKAGRDYAMRRNLVVTGHPHVSGLSPYLRHRIVTEDYVLKAVLRLHSPSAAEKFIQEVYWRTYWKGWLEQRPSVWTAYRTGLSAVLDDVQTQSGLRAEWEAACLGRTGIDCFDHWAQELTETGYLHNHARMWFASIWIFTLRLPWELGADFFIRHLLDGDPASNTLGWRWVAGLQTIGKTYLARADNIAKYTENRFYPTDLVSFAAPLEGLPHPERGPLPQVGHIPPDLLKDGRIGLLLTEDDLSPEWLPQGLPTAIYDGTRHRSPLNVAPNVTDFVSAAIEDMATRLDAPLAKPQTIEELEVWAKDAGLDALVLAHPPVGGTADAIAALKTPVIRQIRPYDLAAWPHAKAGFFKFKTQIPKLLAANDRQLSLL
ncbi:MAG: DNA photolyase [Octadecabacter sp.]|nr:DNA photolyase [Octadecabacter sp.]